MTTVRLKDAKNRLTELARRVEQGETVAVTRHGKPTFDLVRIASPAGSIWRPVINFCGREERLDLFTYAAEDFDAPLPEDFLLRPLPE